MPTKQQSHRGSVHKTMYARQFARTSANKARRAARRARRAAFWKTQPPHAITLSTRAKIRGRLFGFHPQQIAVTTIQLPDSK